MVTSQSRPLLESWWDAGSLCFLLPIAAGDRVVVIGSDDAIPATIRRLGAEPVVVAADLSGGDVAPGHRLGHEGRAIPVPQNAADHVMLPELTPAAVALLAEEVPRVLRPGGTVCIALESRLPAASPRLRDAKRRLRSAGFVGLRSFGVHPGLQQPRHVIPLASRRASSWYAASCLLPQSAWQRLLVNLVTVLRLPLPTSAFPAVAVTALRPGADAC